MKATNDHVAQSALIADTIFETAFSMLNELKPNELDDADWRALVLGALEGTLEVIIDEEHLTEDRQKLRVVSAALAKTDTFRRLVEEKAGARKTAGAPKRRPRRKS